MTDDLQIASMSQLLSDDFNLADLLKEEGLMGEKVTVARGGRLIQPGEMEKHLYYIEEGGFRIFFEHRGEEYITRLAYSGEVITALDSFITRKPTEYYIEALRSAVVRIIDLEEYQRFIRAEPKRMQFWEQMLEGLVFQQMERERDLLMPSPQERYERVLSRSPKLFREIPRKYIASYLRMTPETLSRILKNVDPDQ